MQTVSSDIRHTKHNVEKKKMRHCLRNTLLVIRNNLSNICRLRYDSGLKCCVFPRSKPFVLDPANPTNNVCIRDARDVKGWRIVAAVATMTLQRLNHALKGINFDENWQIEQV